MLSKYRLSLCILAVLALLVGCAPTPAPLQPAPHTTTDDEWRGVWVSYLDLQALLADTTPATAATAIDGVMDTCVSAGLNRVLFHARSHSDAWYQSEQFPPATPLLSQGFDPLGYAVEAAHKRGLQLHAWINPYRIGPDKSRAVVEEQNALFQKDGSWYYNPASTVVQATIVAGVREIVEGYGVDGIHFDDYFYPAGMAAGGEAFEAIPAGTDVAAWRCAQVNSLLAAVHGLCYRAGRPFGVSPAGSPTACATGYADVATWLAVPGYIDYLCPQIYFGFRHETKPFDTLLSQWQALPRHDGVALYTGLALYKAGLADDPYAGSGRTEWAEDSHILARQVATLREQGITGFGLYRYAGLTDTSATVAAARQALLAAIQSTSERSNPP